MVGKRWSLSRQDKKCMRCFVDENSDRDNENFLKIVDVWHSTTDVNEKLVEPAGRTKRRLDKLEEFELVHKRQENHGKLINNLWYPTHEGVYYILSILENNKKRKEFIEKNKEKSHLVLLLKHQVSAIRINSFAKDIKKCFEKQEYHKIMTIIESFIQKIEKRYVDWPELVPNSKSQIYNPKTGEDELF